MFEKFIASILLVSLVTTNASFAMDPPLDCGDGGYRGTYLNFDGCDGGGFGGFEDAGTSSGFGNGSSVGGEYEATLGLDSSDSSSFAGGNHTWYTDPKAPPDGPPALLKYYALIKPTTPIELERYYALNRFYPNMGTKDEFRQRTKAYKEYNDWIPLERARAKLEAYKAEDVKRVEDAIALEKKQAEENRIRNEQLEAEMAPIRRQYQEDQQRLWDNWQRELVEKKAARLAQQEIDIAAFAEIHEQRHAALVIRNEERTARELAQKEAADKAKILSRNAEVSRRSASIAAQQAKADSVTTKAVAALCFTGETQISISPEESAPIASIKVGDYVETCDVNSFICERLRVTSVTRNIATHILNLNINGEITRVTNSHPYYSVSRSKWVKASELAEGEMLRTLSGETAALNGVSDEYGHFYVYNFEVEKNHNYYANGILVHNCTIGVVTAEAVGMAGLSTLVASALVTNYIVDKVTDFAARVHDIIR